MDNLPDSLTVNQQDELLFIKLNRAEKRNAINDSLVLGLEHIFDTLATSVKAIVLNSEGKHFSSGLDLNELTERNAVEGIYHSRMWHRVFDKMQFGRVPIVAALHGGVIGGGLELASTAHLRVAEPSTFYALPEGQRGIFVGGGASVRVQGLIGTARMMDMMLTGRVLNADEGYHMGLSQYLVEEGEGLTKATELAKKVAENSEITNYALLNVLPRISQTTQDVGLVMESLIASISQDSDEAKQRLELFLAKKAKKVGEV